MGHLSSPTTPSPTLEGLASWDNLLLAYRKAARGKRGQANVAAFEHYLEDHLASLRAALLDRSYQPGSYTSFFIHDPKRRLISAAPFGDRVVHHALCNLIEQLFERSFIEHTYANRVGKGTHRALDRCQQLARRFPYFLQLDVRQFFPSIDHAVLRSMLFEKIEDFGLRWLIDRILASGSGVLDEVYRMVYFLGDDLFAINRPRGLPIGNLTSQFWGNVYLSGLDHFVTRRLRLPYLRYVDDLLLFARAKSELWDAKRAVRDRLERLRLTAHPKAHPRPCAEGIPFLGFVVYPERRRLKRRQGIAYERRLRPLVDGSGDENADRMRLSLAGWTNYLRYGNTVGMRKALLARVGMRLEREGSLFGGPTAVRPGPSLC